VRLRGFEVVADYQEQEINLPTRKTIASAGYDIEASEDVVLAPHKVSIIPTGIKAYMQTDEYLGIHIRSGFSIKKSLSLINSQGVIDADYYNNADNEGHIMIAVFNHGDQNVDIEKGMRIAQGIFYKYLTVDDDLVSDNAIRQGGIGSTGEK
jgi:dUTP pyrophosphatase